MYLLSSKNVSIYNRDVNDPNSFWCMFVDYNLTDTEFIVASKGMYYNSVVHLLEISLKFYR